MSHEDEVSKFFRIRELVKTEFAIRDAYVFEGTPTFVISQEPNFVEKLNRLRIKLSEESLRLSTEPQDGEIVLRVTQLGPPPTRRILGKPNLPIILFFATLATVTASGYISASSFVQILRLLNRIPLRDVSTTIWLQTALYTVTIMSTIGLHELGHILACRRHKVEASFPIFIPGIPGATPGTFGAIILQKGPALNRNQLFDIGIAGPLFGFTVALVASFAGYALSLPISFAEYKYLTSVLGGEGVSITLPLLFIYLSPHLVPQNNAYIYYLHPLGWAAWVSTLITFLNAFPIGQLDGGHVSRAVLKPKQHRLLGYLMVGVMILAGWFFMALLVLLFVRTSHPGLLDEATPLSRGRKFIAVVFAMMFLASFTLSGESPLLLILP
ncbi:MAG: site-2 protease family protein [Candidatus Bathyarchaeia archaeon]